MKLWLLRHARAVNRAESGRDQDRALSEGGADTADRLGRWLAKSDLEMPARILVSPALRTRQTAERVVPDDHAASVEERLWDALEEDLLAILNDHADADELMLIGHNPGLEWLVQWASGKRPRLGMQPASLAIMELPTPPAPGTGVIERVIQPSELT